LRQGTDPVPETHARGRDVGGYRRRGDPRRRAREGARRRGQPAEGGENLGEGLMSGFEIVVIAILIFVAITIGKGVRIVPQGEEWIVERLGKYTETLQPGLSIIIPYLDKVAYKVITKDIILDVPQQEVITKDNAVIITNAIAFIKVTDPIK